MVLTNSAADDGVYLSVCVCVCAHTRQPWSMVIQWFFLSAFISDPSQ